MNGALSCYPGTRHLVGNVGAEVVVSEYCPPGESLHGDCSLGYPMAREVTVRRSPGLKTHTSMPIVRPEHLPLCY